MKKVLCAFLIVIAILITASPISNVYAANVDNEISINETIIDTGLKKVEITKNNQMKKSSSSINKGDALIDKYYLDRDLYEKSSHIIVQEEELLAPTGYNFETEDGQTFYFSSEDIANGFTLTADGKIISIDNTVSGVWDKGDGRLTIYTSAYFTGYTTSGSARYTIESTVIIHNPFSKRQQDEMIIRHSEGAAFDSSHPNEYGQQGYHEYFSSSTPISHNTHDIDIINTLVPSFAEGPGIQYGFTFPSNFAQGAAGCVVIREYTQWWVKGQYGIAVFHDTNVQTGYFNNQKILGGKLSITFGYYGGVSIAVSGTSADYVTRPITIYYNA